MKSSAFIISILATVLLYSCTKQPHLTPQERRAIGQYTFEKVIRNDGFLKSDDVTHEYHNMILQLNEHKEAALIDQDNDITYLGKYDVVTQDMVSNDGSTTTEEHTIIIDIKPNGGRGNNFHWVGEEAQINQQKIRFKVQKADGRYRFKLNKL